MPSTSSTLSEPLAGLPADALLRRALESARSVYIRKGTLEPRWAAIRNCLILSELQARRLCQWADLDPDDLVRRWRLGPGAPRVP